MSKKLFVGGLNWTTTDEGLMRAFEKFGRIDEAKVVMDRGTGRSRGFGFVTYAEGANGARAIAAMDGSQIDERAIKVNEAQDKPRRDSGLRRP